MCMEPALPSLSLLTHTQTLSLFPSLLEEATRVKALPTFARTLARSRMRAAESTVQEKI